MAQIPDETASPRRIANLALIWRFTARYKGLPGEPSVSVTLE